MFLAAEAIRHPKVVAGGVATIVIAILVGIFVVVLAILFLRKWACDNYKYILPGAFCKDVDQKCTLENKDQVCPSGWICAKRNDKGVGICSFNCFTNKDCKDGWTCDPTSKVCTPPPICTQDRNPCPPEAPLCTLQGNCAQCLVSDDCQKIFPNTKSSCVNGRCVVEGKYRCQNYTQCGGYMCGSDGFCVFECQDNNGCNYPTYACNTASKTCSVNIRRCGKDEPPCFTGEVCVGGICKNPGFLNEAQTKVESLENESFFNPTSFYDWNGYSSQLENGSFYNPSQSVEPYLQFYTGPNSVVSTTQDVNKGPFATYSMSNLFNHPEINQFLQQVPLENPNGFAMTNANPYPTNIRTNVVNSLKIMNATPYGLWTYYLQSQCQSGYRMESNFRVQVLEAASQNTGFPIFQVGLNGLTSWTCKDIKLNNCKFPTTSNCMVDALVFKCYQVGTGLQANTVTITCTNPTTRQDETVATGVFDSVDQIGFLFISDDAFKKYTIGGELLLKVTFSGQCWSSSDCVASLGNDSTCVSNICFKNCPQSLCNAKDTRCAVFPSTPDGNDTCVYLNSSVPSNENTMFQTQQFIPWEFANSATANLQNENQSNVQGQSVPYYIYNVIKYIKDVWDSGAPRKSGDTWVPCNLRGFNLNAGVRKLRITNNTDTMLCLFFSLYGESTLYYGAPKCVDDNNAACGGFLPVYLDSNRTIDLEYPKGLCPRGDIDSAVFMFVWIYKAIFAQGSLFAEFPVIIKSDNMSSINGYQSSRFCLRGNDYVDSDTWTLTSPCTIVYQDSQGKVIPPQYANASSDVVCDYAQQSNKNIYYFRPSENNC